MQVFFDESSEYCDVAGYDYIMLLLYKAFSIFILLYQTKIMFVRFSSTKVANTFLAGGDRRADLESV